MPGRSVQMSSAVIGCHRLSSAVPMSSAQCLLLNDPLLIAPRRLNTPPPHTHTPIDRRAAHIHLTTPKRPSQPPRPLLIAPALFLNTSHLRVDRRAACGRKVRRARVSAGLSKRRRKRDGGRARAGGQPE
eukprot:181217-Chlamydomonas_euryale.AAC.2